MNERSGSEESSPAGSEPRELVDDRLLVGLVAAVLLCLLLAALLLGLRDLASALMLLGVLGLMSAGLTLWILKQFDRRETTLTTLAIAVEHGIPLNLTLEALADQQPGRSRRRILALIGFLNQGAPLPQALNHFPGILPPDATFVIAAGWSSNHLGEALREAADARAMRRVLQAKIAPRIGYLTTILFIMQIITSFILYFILPKYEAIFKDFGVPFPGVTIAVVQVAYTLSRWGWPIILLLMIFELSMAVVLPLSLAGRLPAHFFGLDRLFRSRHTAPVLRALAWAVEAGRPLSTVVSSLAHNDSRGWVHRRLELVLQDMNAGAEIWKSLMRRGLIGRADAAILESASGMGNLPWALREVAEGVSRRFLIRIQRWILVLSTLVLLGLGIMVMVLTAAFLVPLATLITSLAS